MENRDAVAEARMHARRCGVSEISGTRMIAPSAFEHFGGRLQVDLGLARPVAP